MDRFRAGNSNSFMADYRALCESMWFLGLSMAIFLGLLGASAVGGASGVFKHYTLRFILWLIGQLPWRLTSFLAYATDRIFLCKVGGGYIFIHRSLMEYFASLTPEEIEQLAADIESRPA